MTDEDAEDMLREVERERIAPQPTPEPRRACECKETGGGHKLDCPVLKSRIRDYWAAPQGVGKLSPEQRLQRLESCFCVYDLADLYACSCEELTGIPHEHSCLICEIAGRGDAAEQEQNKAGTASSNACSRESSALSERPAAEPKGVEGVGQTARELFEAAKAFIDALPDGEYHGLGRLRMAIRAMEQER